MCIRDRHQLVHGIERDQFHRGVGLRGAIDIRSGKGNRRLIAVHAVNGNAKSLAHVVVARGLHHVSRLGRMRIQRRIGPRKALALSACMGGDRIVLMKVLVQIFLEPLVGPMAQQHELIEFTSREIGGSGEKKARIAVAGGHRLDAFDQCGWRGGAPEQFDRGQHIVEMIELVVKHSHVPPNIKNEPQGTIARTFFNDNWNKVQPPRGSAGPRPALTR